MAGLLLVCALQFFNSMILGSLLISFNLAVLIARKLQVGLCPQSKLFNCVVCGALRAVLALCRSAWGSISVFRLPLRHPFDVKLSIS